MQFRERYDIVRLLGRGTNASVFLVRDKHLNKHWAAKIFDVSRLGQTERKSVENEVQILIQLESLQMPRVVDLYREEHQICIVMDYMEGDSLKTYIKNYGPVSERTALVWMEELCCILEQLHQRNPAITYCDLKPENIILRKSGHLALIDLGSARYSKVFCADQLPLAGSRGYTAPELFENPKDLLPIADIYSIGAVGAFLVTGFHPDCWQQFRQEFSKPFVQIIEGCFLKVGQRIKNCEKLKKEIQVGRGKCI